MGKYVVNAGDEPIAVMRTKTCKIPARSIIEVKTLAGNLGTNQRDIRNSIEVQYPGLRIVNVAAEGGYWSDAGGDNTVGSGS